MSYVKTSSILKKNKRDYEMTSNGSNIAYIVDGYLVDDGTSADFPSIEFVLNTGKTFRVPLFELTGILKSYIK